MGYVLAGAFLISFASIFVKVADVGPTAAMFYRKETADPSATPPILDNTWSAYTFVDGINATVGGNAAADVQFNLNGGLATGLGDVDVLGRVTLDDFTPGGGAAVMSGVTMDYSSASQFGSGFAVNELSQNGFTSGNLSGVEVDSSGVVFARFTNGQSEPLGKIALARFNSNQGLRQNGDTSWVESFSSGDMQMGEAGTSSLGLIQSGALENSNVDLTQELVGLIEAQRNFQASAQIVRTADTVTQTVINIR